MKPNKSSVPGKSLLNSRSASLRDSSFTDSIKKAAAAGKGLPSKKSLLTKLIPSSSGNISLGYDYGVIPFAVNTNPPLGYFKTEGNMSLGIAGLPLNATFYYSTLKNISGLNNYFRVSFDAAAFRNQQLDKLNDKRNVYTHAIDSLEKQKLALKNKMLFGQYLSSSLRNYYTELDQYRNVKDFPSAQQLNQLSSGDSLLSFAVDSLQQLKNTIPFDTTGAGIKEKQRIDSLLYIYNKLVDLKKNFNISSIDTSALNSQYSGLQSQANAAQAQIQDLKGKSRMLNDSNLLAAGTSYLPGFGKFKKVLFNTKKLEVGMCYPNYSTFLVSGIALRGINWELENKDFFFAATAGKTINNIYFTNNLIDNVVNKNRNALNFFDFNNVESGRSVASVKFGYGKAMSSHLHVGVLYGIGRHNLYNSSPDDKVLEKEKNYVVEVDGRINIKRAYLQLAYGKSSLQSNSIVYNEIATGIKGVFTNFRSNAVLFKTVVPISRIKNNVSFTFRLVDPFFKSYGVGFMRSDNIRYEFKTDQSLFKSKMKLGAYLRLEEDNILNFLSYKNRIRSAGFYSSIRIRRDLSLRVDYSPLVQVVQSQGEKFERHNSITNVILSLLPGNNKLNSSLNLMGSYYNLSSGSSYSDFYTTNLTASTQLSKHFQNNVYAGWFYVNGKDSLNTGLGNSYILNEELQVKASSAISFSANLKLASSQSAGFQSGYGLKFNAKLNKHFSWDISGEKIVIGDFYNAYPIEWINKFPYYCSTKINISW